MFGTFEMDLDLTVIINQRGFVKACNCQYSELMGHAWMDAYLMAVSEDIRYLRHRLPGCGVLCQVLKV